jgi:hypothetical protein
MVLECEDFEGAFEQVIRKIEGTHQGWSGLQKVEKLYAYWRKRQSGWP